MDHNKSDDEPGKTPPPNPTPTLQVPGTQPADPQTMQQPPVNSGDLRTSWVYSLKKGDLVVQLQKLHLTTAGTVDDMRRRLSKFIRDGQATPEPTAQHFPFPVITTGTTTIPVPVTTVTQTSVTNSPMTKPTVIPGIATAPITDIVSQVHRWNIHFNGKSDPATFLERLEEIYSSQNIDPDRLLPYLPELLLGEAALWFRNNRHNWRSWAEFKTDFRTFYYPVNYEVDLEAEISRRLQQDNETAASYITGLQTLIRRHGNIRPDQELNWLYRNLRPEFRQYIRRTDFDNIASFSKSVKEFEALNKELYPRVHRQQPPASLPPNLHNTALRSPNPPGTPVSQYHRRNFHTETPTSNRRGSTSGVICWKCGNSGHLRHQCRARGKLFCSRCGKEGVMSRNCTCTMQEN